MAEMDTSLGNLWWIQNPHWASEPNASEAGVKMAQFGAQMALRQNQLDLERRQFDVQMQGHLLDQQLKKLQLTDAEELQKGASALAAGQDYQPRLTTHTAAMTWQSMRSNNDLVMARQSAQVARNKRAAETILEVPESEEYIFPQPGRLDSNALARWSAIADEQKQQRQIRLREVAPTIAAESREEIERMRLEGIANQKTSGDASAVTMEDGTTVPGMVKFWTGRTWQIRSVHDSQFKELTHSQQISALNALIKTSNDDKETQQYRKQLQDLLSAKPAPAAPAPASTTTPKVGEIRRGYKYLGGDPADPASWQKQ